MSCDCSLRIDAGTRKFVACRPVSPDNRIRPCLWCFQVATVPPAELNVTESPAWPFRGLHVHTEHPLELVELMQGMDTMQQLDDDNGGTGISETWESMLPQWWLLMEWLVANRQNRIEWVLLCAGEWRTLCYDSTRLQRIAMLATIARAHGVAPGADVPIVEHQQHAWMMVNRTNAKDPGVAEQSIRDHIDLIAVSVHRANTLVLLRASYFLHASSSCVAPFWSLLRPPH